ncbi:helix-turn-helix transcriptional regulator [Paenibacillus sp. FSL L8-0436]|uniref:helix-turn-helix domain-containing protein n=1 Tax=Paenibacillus sp. FSL L8-0436 TaxID=2954686 RepID=UPI00315894BE
MNVLGQRIKQLREDRGITQRELRDLLGYKETRSVQRIESGETAVDHEKLIILADFFNVSADYILGRTDTLD